jgi:SNF2 family DNA or RNA helicase
VLDEMLIRLKPERDKRRKGIVLAAMTKLKQVCNHPAQLLGDGSPLPGRSGKLERLEEILDSILADGERALCFTQFTRFGSLLVPHLAARFNVPVRYLHGGTSRGERDALVSAFQADARPGIFVLSLKAGGTGLNLTAANHVVHVDRWWNPATEAQATDRAFRIGQDRDVRVHTLVCLGTLEERIDALIADKGVLAERVVGTGEGWLTALSTSDLRDLLALAPEAVGD